MNSNNTRPVWVEVDLDKLEYNYKEVKKRINSNTVVMAIVKADAYGHGALEIASRLVECGVERLGVALPEEGAELRKAGFKLPIQVLGEVLPSQYSLLLDYNLIPTIGRLDTLRAINKLALDRSIRSKVHIKIDTGMGRIGYTPEASLEFILKIIGFKGIELEGLMTHFATADEENKEYAYHQWERFDYLIRKLNGKGVSVPISHAANSAAVIDLPDFQLNMVRPGIMLYGLRPSAEVDQDIKLKPILSWKSRVVFVKEVSAGTAISYGSTYITDKKSRIATIPLGYADGYPRLLSNKGYVLIAGQQAPIVGRICMDQFMVDVTDISGVNVGDDVVLIGEQGQKEISATEIADMVGTINYEITCLISKRVPRIYI